MDNGFKIGRVLGIDIVADFSWIYIFLLVTFNLAVGIFPSIHPDWGFLLNLIVGIVASLLFFASILIHELAHSVVAKSRGLPVKHIVLFLFGGVSNIEHEPPNPKTEFLMAFVGPFSSIILGILFLLGGTRLANNTGNMTEPNNIFSEVGPIPTLFLWLGPVNILLGIFNLIPGFPMDGGRLLRSIVWAISHNFAFATRIAMATGRIVALLFIAAGALMIFGIPVPFFGSGTLSGLWLVFIGWFLNSAGSQESSDHPDHP